MAEETTIIATQSKTQEQMLQELVEAVRLCRILRSRQDFPENEFCIEAFYNVGFVAGFKQELMKKYLPPDGLLVTLGYVKEISDGSEEMPKGVWYAMTNKDFAQKDLEAVAYVYICTH